MRAAGGNGFRLFISAVAILLNIARCPELLLTPRFFAEEGTTYFSGAFHNSFVSNLFSAHYGYYTLYNQLATSLATLAPLEHAPLVTTLMALLVQVGVSLHVLWGDIPLLDTPWRRTALALAIPLVSWPGHWLTIIGSQCWLAAGTFLLLLGANRNRSVIGYGTRGGYLILAGLTGVISCFMAPAYLWRSFREKSREYLAYGAILILSLTIHAGVLLQALLSRPAEIDGRFVATSFMPMLGKTVVYQFAIPFTGRGFFERHFFVALGSGIRERVEHLFGVQLLIHDLFVIPLLTGIAVITLTAIILWQNRSRLDVQLMALALVIVTVMSNLCSVNTSGGPRYYFIPSLVLLTLFLGIGELKRIRPVCAGASLLVLTTLLANGYEYRSVMGRQAFNPDYPDWRTELVLWKTAPSYRINIWPPPWKMTLDRRFTPPDT